MEFLVEFQIGIPEGAPSGEVREREDTEAAAAAKLADEGHLLRDTTFRRCAQRSRIPNLERPVGLRGRARPVILDFRRVSRWAG